ncbi:hypothetical protein AI2618V1_2782 [Serratia marcescens]|nr:hypothetical protein AI2618V1_2782 [Serratia marcescens]CAE7315044.1 hypothetical protein AI2617V1_2779 [Serratia marcescens]CAH3744510.1 hypothetical protein AI2618V1_2782 [Serratia marcescens]CAH3988401.1 hypothetical protein AI2617V1_2779 [Serratia marcescens]CAI1527570.1 Uncharacterised protein [Serratia marcescens]
MTIKHGIGFIYALAWNSFSLAGSAGVRIFGGFCTMVKDAIY